MIIQKGDERWQWRTSTPSLGARTVYGTYFTHITRLQEKKAMHGMKCETFHIVADWLGFRDDVNGYRAAMQNRVPKEKEGAIRIEGSIQHGKNSV